MKWMLDTWDKLQLRHQLTIAFIGLSFIILSFLFVTIQHYNREVLTSRAFDLLEARNAAATQHFNMRMRSVTNRSQSCGKLANRFFEETRTSPWFISSKVFSIEKHMEPVSFDEILPRIAFFLDCVPLPGQRTRAVVDARWLSDIFGDRSGLGASGELYLVREDGKLLTESRFEEHPRPAVVPDTKGAMWAGKTQDYRDVSVYSIWNPVAVGSFRGFIVTDIDKDEVLGPSKKLSIYLVIFVSLVFGVTVILAPFLSRGLSWRTEQRAALQKVRNLSLLEGEEKERKRLGMELHDDIGQELAALMWKVDGLALGSEDKRKLVLNIQQVSRKVKYLATDLLHAYLSQQGIVESARSLVANFQQQGINKGIQFHLNVSGDEHNFPRHQPQFNAGIYRIIQEGLNNVMKHSRATEAQVHLSFMADKLHITIEDNGHGHELAQESYKEKSSLGLHTIQIRTEALGGRVKFGDSSFGGFMVDATFESKGDIS